MLPIYLVAATATAPFAAFSMIDATACGPTRVRGLVASSLASARRDRWREDGPSHSGRTLTAFGSVPAIVPGRTNPRRAAAATAELGKDDSRTRKPEGPCQG